MKLKFLAREGKLDATNDMAAGQHIPLHKFFLVGKFENAPDKIRSDLVAI